MRRQLRGLMVLGLLAVLLTGCDTGRALEQAEAGAAIAEERLAQAEGLVEDLLSRRAQAEAALAQAQALAEQLGSEQAARLAAQAEAGLERLAATVEEVQAGLPELRDLAVRARSAAQAARQQYESGAADWEVWLGYGLSVVGGLLAAWQRWEAGRERFALRLTAEHADRMEKLVAGQAGKDLVDDVKQASKSQQHAAGVQRRIQAARGKSA